MKHRSRNIIPAFIALVGIAGCAGSDGRRACLSSATCTEPEIQSTPPQAATLPDAFRCTVEATPQVINAATQNPPTSDQTATLRIYAVNGSGRYSIPGYVSNFASSATHSGGFYNDTSASVVRTTTVKVLDLQTNVTTECGASITVRPRNNPSYTSVPYSTCTISGKDTPLVNEQVSYGISIQNVAAPFDISSLTYDVTKAIAVTRSSDIQAQTGTFGFTTTGVQRISVNLTKSGAAVAYCERIINVRPAPTLTLTASSLHSVVGSPLMIETYAKHFLGTPDLTFVTDRADVTVQKIGSTATVTSNVPQTVRITASATLGSEAVSPSPSVVLTFGNASAAALNCRLTPIITGGVVRYSVAPVAGSETLVLSELNLTSGDGGRLTSALTNFADVTYDTSGFKTVSAKAHVQGDPSRTCNGGQLLFASAPIGTNPACSVFTSPNPSLINGRVVVTAMPTAGTIGTYDIESVSTSAPSYWVNPNNSPVSSLNRDLYFYTAGDFAVDVIIKERTSNARAVCSSRQIVTTGTSSSQCTANYTYPDGTFVTTARAREDLRVSVWSAFPYGYFRFFAGAEFFSRPNNSFAYKNAGFVNGTVTVTNTQTNQNTQYSLPLNLTAALSCQISTTSVGTLIKTTDITNLSNSRATSGTTLSVAVSATAQNAKAGLYFSLSGDGLATTSSSSPTVNYSEHGTYGINATVYDSRDTLGGSCNSSVRVDAIRNVTVVADSAATSAETLADTATVTVVNQSSAIVSVRFKATTRDGVVESTHSVPANGTSTSASFKRNTDGKFNIELRADGTQPRTYGNLGARIDATIRGVSRTYQLGTL